MEFWQICPFFRSIFRHEKKVLALVLAFACAFTMFAGAAFTDEADINADNRDAVELLTALNIIQGYEDGSFDPEGTVDRAEMAKMIYVIRNGGNDDASAYETVTTSFTDISGHWAEGYIKYLQNTGIVAGKSATKFDPDSQVTTGEAMKMALALAGYDEEHAGLTGINWLNNTVSQATTVGMTDDVHSAIAGGCTRQDAAQILSNTLVNTGAVRWSAVVEGFVPDSETGLAYGGRWISVGEKWMDLSVETGFITAAPSSKTNPKGITFVWDEDDDGVYGENDSRNNTESVTFRNSNLDVSDLFGYEVKAVWNSDDVSAADAVYGFYKTSNNVSYEMTWQDVEQDVDRVKFDGKSYDLTSTPIGAESADDKITVYADADEYTWDSADFTNTDLADTVVFIDNNNDGDLDAVQVKTQTVAQVGYIGTRNITTSALVGGNQDIWGITYDNSPDLDDIILDENIAADDYAIVSYDYYNDKVTYTKVDVLDGTVEATRTQDGTKQVRIGEQWYKCTEGYDYPTTIVTGDTVEYVAIGNLLYYIDKTDGMWGSRYLAVIYDAAEYDVGVNTGKVEARIILRNGDKVTGIVDSIDTNDNPSDAQVRDYIGQPMTYRINSDGEYEFKSLTDSNLAGYDSAWSYTGSSLDEITNNDPQGKNTALTTATVVSGNQMAGARLADDAVVFVIEKAVNPYDVDGVATDAKVFTGRQIKNLNGDDQADLKADESFVFLRSTDNGFTYTMAGSLIVDEMPNKLVGAYYGYLLEDAAEWIDSEDNEGYRYFSMLTDEGEVTVREKSGENYTYEAGTVLNFNLVSVNEETGVWTIDDLNRPVLTSGVVTSNNNGKTPGSTIGIDGDWHEITEDTVILFVDTETHEWTPFDEGTIMKGNTIDNVPNVYYLTIGSNTEDLEFLLVDTNAEVNDVPEQIMGADNTVAEVNAALQVGDVRITSALAGDGTITVPNGRTLTVESRDYLPKGTTAKTVTVQPTGMLVLAGTQMIGGTGLTSEANISVEFWDTATNYIATDDVVLNGGTLTLNGSSELKGAVKLTGKNGAKVICDSAWTCGATNDAKNAWIIDQNDDDNTYLSNGYDYNWNSTNNYWDWVSNT